MIQKITVECPFQVQVETKGRKRVEQGKESGAVKPVERVPRISRLMALAIRFDELVRTGQVKDYAELATLGRVSRARITQIMNLVNLSPAMQEALLFMTCDNHSVRARLAQLQSDAANLDWREQRLD